MFSLNPNTGVETVVHSFSYTDGYYPESSLINVNGTLYGTTLYGGTYSIGGVVFSLDPASGTETVLHSFSYGGTDGYQPHGRLLNVNGNLYGTTQYGGGDGCGGSNGCGAVFSINITHNAEAILYSFGSYGGDGESPIAGLIRVNGILYGTTQGGGAYGYGTVFALTR